MFPSKSFLPYCSEMNRLFPASNENEPPHLLHPMNTPRSVFNTPTLPSFTNHSSSSADSTSPESYPDIAFRTPETPTAPKRQRPIIGRKIFASNDMPPRYESPVPTSMYTSYESDMDWSPLSQMSTVPEESLYSISPPSNFYRYGTINANYELFPSENNNYMGFRTPMKGQRMPGQNSANVSPSSSSYSPVRKLSPNALTFSPNRTYNFPTTRISPLDIHNYNRFDTQRVTQNRFTVPQGYKVQQTNRQVDAIAGSKICTFCRKNGETPEVYLGHILKEKICGRNVVTCPILRKHVCDTCGATGDNAHTKTYCPVHRSTNNGMPLQSTTIILKNTPLKSNGKRRY